MIGLLQFVSTFVITTLYVRFARRAVDPARRGDPGADGAAVTRRRATVFVNIGSS